MLGIVQLPSAHGGGDTRWGPRGVPWLVPFIPFRSLQTSTVAVHVVPDTSVVVDGRVSERIDAGQFRDATISIPEAVVAELEAQANDGRESGWDGIEELQRLADRADEGQITIEHIGKRPDAVARGHAEEGEIDAYIRSLAADRDATFFTSDIVQAEVARGKGIDVEYVAPRTETVDRLTIEEYFDAETMSVHLREDAVPMAKRGSIGEMSFQEIADAPLSADDLRDLIQETQNAARQSDVGFVELSEPGMTIVQFRDYRIALAEPPFADGLEITAVRPIVQTSLEEYAHSEDLKDRLLSQQRGVLISGAPGAGKSTFAQAVGEFLADNDFAVKTMENPRDLQVGPEITQYTELGGDMARTADALLMVRPDYTIYDEVRKTHDFEVFADMRMAGVGMVGVVHATRAIDALQRLVGRVELGMIPQIVDTVVYIEAGEIVTVYDVETEVKVPHGLTAEDLARPVIVIRDFVTREPAYEIYTFNRQVVTVPLEDADSDDDRGVERIARDEIKREIRSVASGPVDVELNGQNAATVYVTENDISTVIGKGGGRIQDIENRLGIDIDVQTHDEQSPAGGSSTTTHADDGRIVDPEVTSRHIVLPADGLAGETVEVQAGGTYVCTATVSRGGEVQISRGSAIADELEAAIDRRQPITIQRS